MRSAVPKGVRGNRSCLVASLHRGIRRGNPKFCASALLIEVQPLTPPKFPRKCDSTKAEFPFRMSNPGRLIGWRFSKVYSSEHRGKRKPGESALHKETLQATGRTTRVLNRPREFTRMPAVPTPRISLHQAPRKSDDFSANGTVSFPFCLTSGGHPKFCQPTNLQLENLQAHTNQRRKHVRPNASHQAV